MDIQDENDKIKNAQKTAETEKEQPVDAVAKDASSEQKDAE